MFLGGGGRDQDWDWVCGEKPQRKTSDAATTAPNGPDN